MRGFPSRRQCRFAQERTQRGWLPRAFVALLMGAACLVIAACGSPSTPQLNLPGGTFSNTTYSFHITYPRNWKVNSFDATPSASGSAVAIPFNLVITRTGDTHSAASLISTCTITVMNMKNKDIAKSAADLATNKALHAATIGGAQGYKSNPLVQDIPNTQISVTHMDYYVIHGDYEYQISTDSVKGDNADADLESMIASFAFGA
jgi:hypothetical protein